MDSPSSTPDNPPAAAIETTPPTPEPQGAGEELEQSRLNQLGQFAVRMATDTIISKGLSRIQPEIVLPAALAIGVVQVVRNQPMPSELGERIKSGKVLGAARSIGGYAIANAHHLMSKKNAAGYVLGRFGGPVGDKLVGGAQAILEPLSDDTAKKSPKAYLRRVARNYKAGGA